MADLAHELIRSRSCPRAGRARHRHRGHRSAAGGGGRTGPTTRTASISPDVNDPGAQHLLRPAGRGHHEQPGGSTAAPTCSSSRPSSTPSTPRPRSSPRDALRGGGTRWPVIISGTITDASGRTLSGQVTEAFWYSIRHVRPLAVGSELRARRRRMRPYVAELARLADCFVCAYPQRRSPQRLREYDDAAQMASVIEGICARWPGQHGRRLLRAPRPTTLRRSPRGRGVHAPRPAVIEPALRLSGLEPLVVTEDSLFVNVGERTNITGSARFRKLIKEGTTPPPLTVARSRSRPAHRSSTSTWTRA